MHYLDLIDQGLLEIPNEDIALLNQYKPLTIENYTDYNNDFYNERCDFLANLAAKNSILIEDKGYLNN